MKRPGDSHRLALAGLLGTLLAAPAHAEAPGLEELRQRYAGAYRFSGDATERERVPEAVERSVDGMFFIARGIAYDRLLHVCEICSSYTLSFSHGAVEVRSPCQLPDTSPDDGSEVDHKTKAGDASKLSQRFVNGTLQQDFRGAEGSRRVVWTLAPDADGLSVHITITSKHLPHPVDYTLSYRRLSPAAAPSPAVAPRDAGLPGG
jgi:hypothetical protein